MGSPNPQFDKWIEMARSSWEESNSELLDPFTKSANDLADKYRALEEIKLHLITCTKAQYDQPETTVKKLNVGGKIYRFDRSFAEKLQGSLLGYMLSGDYDKLFARDKNGVIFLDLDPFWMDDILDSILYPERKANKMDYLSPYAKTFTVHVKNYVHLIKQYLKVTDLVTGSTPSGKASQATEENKTSISTSSNDQPINVDVTFAPLQNAMNKLAGLQAEFKTFHDKLAQAHAQYVTELQTYRDELVSIATFVFAKRSDWTSIHPKRVEEELLEDIRALVSLLASTVKESKAVGVEDSIGDAEENSTSGTPHRTISLAVGCEYFETSDITLRLAPARTYMWNLASTEWGHTLDEEDGAIMINDFSAEGMRYILWYLRLKRVDEALGRSKLDIYLDLPPYFYDLAYAAQAFCLLEDEMKVLCIGYGGQR
jgi:hypothetical protein